jgi:DNA mismatch endonuclease (patch repair protein)
MDRLTKEQRSRLMSRVRQRGTELERHLRSALRRRGIRYRANVKLPGTPDIAIQTGRIAVFVDGCFWHGCPLHGTMPKTNGNFWQEKIQRNQERDGQVDMALHQLGWKPVRVWEHDIKKSPDGVAETLSKLSARRLFTSEQRAKKRPRPKTMTRRSATAYEKR